MTDVQEHEVVEHCKALDIRFYGLTLRSLRCLLFKYADENNIPHPFNKESKLAGRDFTRAFMKRHRLSLRTARKTSLARVMGFNRIQLSRYFENLKDVLTKYQFLPNRIYNMDETGVQTVPNKLPKHVAPVGKKEVAKSVSSEQGLTVSVACCLSATGQYVPPYFIFRRKRQNLLLIKDGPAGCDMGVTERGYMNTCTFIKWLDHFKKHTNPTPLSPALLILDNHASHVSYEAICHAKENNIHMLSLPPHSSQKTQPLDRVFFKPLKTNYDITVDNWMSSHPGQTVTVYHVAELFKTAYETTASVQKAIESFRVTGIVPLNEHAFSDEDFIPSEVTDQDLNGEQDMEEEERMGIAFDNTEELPSEALDVQSIIAHQAEPQPPTSTAESQLSTSTVAYQTSTSTADPGPSTLRHPRQRELELTPPGSPIDLRPAIEQRIAGTSKTPRDIIPLPKIQIKRKRGRGIKSTLLTSTPNIKVIQDKQIEKSKILADKACRALCKKKKHSKLSNAKVSKKTKIRNDNDDNSSDSTDSHYSLQESSDELNFTSPDESDLEEREISIRGLKPDDFVLAKVFDQNKTSFRLYVAKVIRREPRGLNVLFYKRAQNTMRFIQTVERSYLDVEDVVLQLSKPVLSSSVRYQNMIAFSNDLSEFTIY